MRVAWQLVLWWLGLAAAETQTSDAERECLAHHAAGRKRLVEVGVWHGVTTCVLRKAMASDGVLFAVDPYPVGRMGFSAQRLIARSELAKVPNGSVMWVRCTGAQAAARYAASYREAVDFVFIDADHSYEGVRGDWEGWSGLVAPGGIVALHDSRSSSSRRIDEAGSVVFTREAIAPDRRFATVDVVDTLTVLQRRP